eukprot:TRINITY_DN168_c0_g1_i5.p1 TRINITY_DN168_c0_g1~~TRINITY_DN168_c0_g1_i5.p1  ORF type:complete len:723 (+),score=177.13 TRINITY_DN168_c0_g1_i5:52-2169(+)
MAGSDVWPTVVPQCANCGVSQSIEGIDYLNRIGYADWQQYLWSTGAACEKCGCRRPDWKMVPVGLERPPWTAADGVGACMCCKDQFVQEEEHKQAAATWAETMYAMIAAGAAAAAAAYNRNWSGKHHCRQCGDVVCQKCSGQKMVVGGYGDEPVRVCKVCHARKENLTTKLRLYTPGLGFDFHYAALLRMLVLQELNGVTVDISDAGRLRCPSCQAEQYPHASTGVEECQKCGRPAPLPSGSYMGTSGEWQPCPGEKQFMLALPKTATQSAQVEPVPKTAVAADMLIRELVRRGAQRKRHSRSLPMWVCRGCRTESPFQFGPGNAQCDHCCGKLWDAPAGWGVGDDCSVCQRVPVGRDRRVCKACGAVVCHEHKIALEDDDGGDPRTLCQRCGDWVQACRRDASYVVKHSDSGIGACAAIVQCILRVGLQGSCVSVKKEAVHMMRCPGCKHEQERTSAATIQCKACMKSWTSPSLQECKEAMRLSFIATAGWYGLKRTVFGEVGGRVVAPLIEDAVGSALTSWEPVTNFIQVCHRSDDGHTRTDAKGLPEVCDEQHLSGLLRVLGRQAESEARLRGSAPAAVGPQSAPQAAGAQRAAAAVGPHSAPAPAAQGHRDPVASSPSPKHRARRVKWFTGGEEVRFRVAGGRAEFVEGGTPVGFAEYELIDQGLRARLLPSGSEVDLPQDVGERAGVVKFLQSNGVKRFG